MAKTVKIPYQNEPVPLDPTEIPRYLEVELARIAEALKLDPTALSLQGSTTYTIGLVFTWDQIGQVVPQWEVPGGMHNTTSGVTTIPQDGLYSVTFQLEIEPFGAGNKDYYAGVKVEYSGHRGSITWESYDGGADDMPLGCTLQVLQPLYKGDTLSYFIGAEHDQFTGDTTASAAIQILREAGQ